MSFILNLILTAAGQVGLSLLHNWPYLLAGIVIASLLKRFVDAEKVSALLLRFRSVGVLASTLAAVATPLCSCGTTAVVLGMMASTVPWAPIVAFMVASPLTSPEELLYSAGLFGWPFAWTFFLASIFLGLAGGAMATWLENMGWLKNQARLSVLARNTSRNGAAIHPELTSSCTCSQPAATTQPAATHQPAATYQPAAVNPPTNSSVLACACNTFVPLHTDEVRLVRFDELQPQGACACALSLPEVNESRLAATFRSNTAALTKSMAWLAALLKEFYASARQLLPMFLGFAFIGYFLNGLIPASWVASLFGSGNIYSVPLAATLGLPLYINTEGSLPLVRALLDQGMSQGAALAFMISGAGTSFGAIAGALTIARWRVVALVVAILWLGAILSGYGFDLFLALRVF
jgi:uncharacterized membrane protein YraQ (UPF0718 family)